MITMRRLSLLVVGMLVLAFSVLAVAQTKYSVGTVEKVHKVPAERASGTDAALTDAVDTYEISIRVKGDLYVVEFDTFADAEQSLEHLVGRKFEVAVEGNTMLAKTTAGRRLRLPIVHREKGKSSK